MSTETTNKKIKIDNGTTFGRTYTDKAIDAKLPTDLIASANKLSLGAGNTALGNGVNLDGFTYDEATKTLKASGGKSVPPTLNLVDFENGGVRTTITEEEYNNLKNGLYNQVIYGDNFGNNITPNRLFCFITGEDADIYFSYLSTDENGKGLVGLNAYSIDLGEKNNNQYPITINALGVTPFETNIPNINATATAINNLYQLSNSPTSSFVMNINESNDVHKVLMNYVYDGNRYYCYGIESIINNIITYYASNNNEQAINIYKHTLDLNNTNSKTISLFGKHSILVPKDSADTAIDLYIHNIVLKDSAETTTKKIYLTVQSTTNAPATTKELLQTLLGSTSRYIRVSGYTPTNDISAINWTGTFDTSKYDVRGTETLLTDFTIIEDSVVTL